MKDSRGGAETRSGEPHGMRYEKYKQTGFPWLPEIPQAWEVRKLNDVVVSLHTGLNPRKFFELNTDDATNYYVTIREIENGRIVFNKDTARINDEALLLCNRRANLEKDDILFSGTGTIGEVALLDATPDNWGIKEGIYSIKPDVRSIMPKCLCYVLQAEYFLSLARAKAVGTGVKSIPMKVLLTLPIPRPSVEEQCVIVVYLDDKCGKIDELVAAKEKEVELLKELKQTVIADAVTRGVGGGGDRRLVPSGIPWLPQIPEGWDLVRNKSFLKLTDEKVGDRKDNFTLLSLTKQGVIIRDLTEGKGKFPKEFDTYLVVRPDNLVFCLFDIDETPRTVGLVRNIGMLTGAYTNFEVNKQIVLPEFAYYYYLHIDDAKKLRPFYTGLRKVVKTNTFLQIRMPVPPLNEQRAIVAYIKEKTAKIDQAVAGLAQQVAALKEYKQRLIADVVTGQMRVA